MINKKQIKIRHAEHEKELIFTSKYLKQVEMISILQRQINDYQRILRIIEEERNNNTYQDQSANKQGRKFYSNSLYQAKRLYKLHQRGLSLLIKYESDFKEQRFCVPKGIKYRIA